MNIVKTVLRSGHGVASGQSVDDPRFPLGTIRMQAPFFKQGGLDLDAFFGGDFVYGTLNLSVAPKKIAIAKPEFCFPQVKWTDVFPPENFFLSAAEVGFLGKNYKALLYIPDPATKPDHFQGASVVEVIAQRIAGIAPGDEAALAYSETAIDIV